VIGREAVDRGLVDEGRVRLALMENGWGVVPFGQGAWNPEECPAGNALVLDAVRRTRKPIRHAPDLLVGCPRRGVGFVEVVNCGTWERRALELAKMEALSEWAHIAPVWVVDVSDWRAWRHEAGWADSALSDATREGRGSGDPWCLFTRRDSLPFGEVFA